MDTAATSTANAASFLNQAVGTTHVVYFTNVAGYTPTFGACEYPRGGTPCAPGNFWSIGSAWSSTCGTSVCSIVLSSNYYNEFAEVDANEVSLVYVVYSPSGTGQTGSNTGDIELKSVGSDLTTATDPAGTSLSLDTSTSTASNPFTYINQSTSGTHTAYTTYNSSYQATVGTCQYQRGTPECSVAGFSTSGVVCDSNLGTCAYGGISVTANYVTKVVWQYNSVLQGGYTGDIEVKRVGSDQTTATAPTGGSESVDTQSSTTVNPQTFPLLSLNNHSVYAAYNASYNVSVGTCTYARGGSECSVTSFSGNLSISTGNNACDQNLGLCRYDVTPQANTVTKVVFLYTSNSGQQQQNGNATDGDIEVKRVGTDLYTTSAPSGSSMSVDSSAATAVNPYTFANLVSGGTNHQVYATYLPAQYNTSMGYCSYDRNSTECSVTSFSSPTCDSNTGLCSISVPVNDNQVTKVVAKYDLLSQGNFSGDIEVKRVGSDLTTATAPGGISTTIDSQSIPSTNPYTLIDQTLTTHSIYTTYNPTYITSIGTCTYPRGGTECAVTSFSALSAGSGNNLCDPNKGLCRYDTATSGNTVTKVVWKYDLNPTTVSGNTVIERVGIDQTTATVPSIGSQTKVDGGSAVSTNPLVTTLSSGTDHFAQVTYNPSYIVQAGTCNYQVGTVQCIPDVSSITSASIGSGYNQSGQCDTSAGLCREDFTPQSGYITVVAFRYIPVDSSDLSVERIGDDQTVSSVPISSTVNVEQNGTSVFTTSSDPATTTLLTNQTYNVYYTYSPNYQIWTGTCTYARGGTPCTSYSLSYINPGYGYIGSGSGFDASGYCNTATNLCRYDYSNSNADQVTLFVVRYVGASTQITGTNSADVEVKLVGTDLYTSSAPVGALFYLDTNSFGTSNPFIYPGLATTTHTAYATYNPSYLTSVGYCSYPRNTPECAVTSFSPAECDPNLGTCAYNFDLSSYSYNVYKIVWKYDADNLGDLSGDLMVKRVGTDLYASSSPSGINVWVDNVATTTINPTTFDNLVLTTSHTTYATYNSSYQTSVGSCQYPRGDSECTVTNFGPATCDPNTNLCSFSPTINSDQVTKVVWKYDPILTQSYTLSNSGDVIVTAGSVVDNNISAILNPGYPVQTIQLAVSGLPAGATASFNTPSCTLNCNTMLSISTTAATPVGTYPITITSEPLGITTTFNLQVTNAQNATLTICNMITNPDGTLLTSASSTLPTGTLTEAISNSITFSPALSTVTFTPNQATPNESIITPGVNDATCVTFNNLPYGHYYYGEQQIPTGTNWLTPQYNDQDTASVTGPLSFYPYSPELFDSNPANDSERNYNSDGDVEFLPSRTSRTVVIMDSYSDAPAIPPPTVSCYVTPSTITVGVPVTWTAVVSQSGTYNYSWSGTPSFTDSASSTDTTTYTTSGPITATVNVTDTSGNSIGTCVQTVNVNNKPSYIEF
jgi:hypothetical protein